jgi:hypothetical protein
MIAYSKAISAYNSQDSVNYGDIKLHHITESELKSIPTWVKNRPNENGCFHWRAPAFTSLQPDHIPVIGAEQFLELEEYAIILLGNLQEGDRLPIKMIPKNPFGYDIDYLTFQKYSHCFPTSHTYTHSENLVFTDKEGKKTTYKWLPIVYFSEKNHCLIKDLASIIGYWSMCRLNNNESLFLDLFKIIQRERCFHLKPNGQLFYKECFDEHDYPEKQGAIHSFGN